MVHQGYNEKVCEVVSTPELLERVSTVEVELIELDETSDRQHTAENCEPNSLGQVMENFKLCFSYFNTCSSWLMNIFM